MIQTLTAGQTLKSPERLLKTAALHNQHERIFMYNVVMGYSSRSWCECDLEDRRSERMNNLSCFLSVAVVR